MKASKLIYLLALSLVLSLGATGCKKKPTDVTKLPGYVAPVPVGSGNGLGSSGSFVPPPEVRGIDTPGGNPLPEDLSDLSRFNQDAVTLAPQTVHFAFDSSEVRSSEKSKVEAVAAYFKGAPANVALLIEGHCDERGTEEYNRSLGERRALSLREALASLGADSSRITTRSYGEDRPAVTGHDESAYSQNRRGQFIVLTPK